MGSVREPGEVWTQRMKTVLLFSLMEQFWFGRGLDCREVRCGMKAEDGKEGRWAS